MSFLKIESISKTYGESDSIVHALDDISLSIKLGEFVAIMGESGAGKSTLLSVMGAMNTPTLGKYYVDDIDVYALSTEQKADFRREYLGFVFQSFHLIPYLTILENVMLPITNLKIPKSKKESMAMQTLEWVGIDSKSKRLPNQISGGEKERCAVARAIVNAPPVLLADEPTGNLDSRNSKDVMALLTRLNNNGATVIMVTHSTKCATYAQRIIQLRDGSIAKENSISSEKQDPVKAA
ncbi:MAG: ABC transporter ATP-binding protein [Desulfobacteraceae bacterium]|nr:ABC transporter ATP-binding protein [Desulfobacteraceae bacterium]